MTVPDTEAVFERVGVMEGVLDGDTDGVLDLEGVTEDVTVLDLVGLPEGVADCVSGRDGVTVGDTEAVFELEDDLEGDTEGVLELEGDLEGDTEAVLELEGVTEGVNVFDLVGLPEGLFDIMASVTDFDGVTVGVLVGLPVAVTDLEGVTVGVLVRLPVAVTDFEGVTVGLPVAVTENVCKLDDVTVGNPELELEYVDEDDTDIVKLEPLLVANAVELTEPEEVTVAVLLSLCEPCVRVEFTDLLGVCDADTV